MYSAIRFCILLVFSRLAFAGVMVPLPPDPFTLGTGASINNATTASATLAMLSDTTAIAISTQKSWLQELNDEAQKILTWQNQVLQVERYIHDLEENPLQVIVPDINQIIANQKAIDTLAAAIVNDSSSVGANLMNDLTHPDSIGLGYGSRFQLWSEARIKAGQESYNLVQGFIKKASKENENVEAAVLNAQAATGQTANLKAVAQATTQQLLFLQDIKQALRQLLELQTVQYGAANDQEVANTKAVQDMLNNILTHPISPQINITHDTYMGPGTKGSNAF